MMGPEPNGKVTGRSKEGVVDGRGALEDVDDLVGLAGIDATSGMPGIGTVDMAAAQLIQSPCWQRQQRRRSRSIFPGLGAAGRAARS